MPITLITGPVRSGKSRMAERLAQKSSLRVTYIATAQRDPNDEEWNVRIDRHRADRNRNWSTLESADITPTALIERIKTATAEECLLIDALGTWLGARITAHIDQLTDAFASVQSTLDEEANNLSEAMAESSAHIIVVSEQVGWDIVPTAPSARLFRDVLGRMNQNTARKAERAYLVVAGHALQLANPIENF